MKTYILWFVCVLMVGCGRGEFGASTAADDVVKTSADSAEDGQENERLDDGNVNNFANGGNNANDPDPLLGARLDSVGLDVFDLYRVMSAQEQNFVFSPYALNKSLLTLHAASASTTRSQLDSVFGIDGIDPEAAYDIFAQTDATLSADGDREFAVTGVWIGSQFPVAQTFVDVVASFFDVAVRRVNLADAETARVQINNTLRSETAGYATEVLPTNSLPMGDFVIAGATFFDAPWQEGFDVAVTEELPFTRGDGSEIPREFMTRSGSVLATNDGDVQSVVLPLTTGQSVLFISPQAGVESIEEELDLDLIQRLLDQMQVVETTVSIPKMDLTSNFDLRDYAASLGVEFLFDSDASFESTGPNARFGSLTQFSRLAFNEDGLESPEDGAGLDPTASDLRFDRPFIFLVIDVESQTILYIGRLID